MDELVLEIGGRQVREFRSVDFSTGLYDPVGSFNIELGLRPKVASGETAKLYVNGQLELTGLLDEVDEVIEERSHSFRLTGRTLLGLAADCCITDWSTAPSTLEGAASRFLSPLPHLGACKRVIERDAAKEYPGLDVGDTVLSVLNEYAQNRGLLFWTQGDGTLVFGRAKREGAPAFRIDQRTRVVRRRRTDASSRQHSEIRVVSDGLDGATQVVVKNASAPLQKTFVAAYNGSDSAGLKKQAQEYIRQQKLAACRLEYVVPGFSQGGCNWAVNELVRIEDDVLGVHGLYLIGNRSFSLGRPNGSTTTLSIGPALAEQPFKAYPKERIRG